MSRKNVACFSVRTHVGETVTCQEINIARNTELVAQQLPTIPCSGCVAWQSVTEDIGVDAFAQASGAFTAAEYSM